MIFTPLSSADSAAAGSRGPAWFRASLLVIVVAAVLRIVLIFRGGQFALFDEGRYNVSRAAASEIVQGHFRKGIALPLEGGDHVGFKELGLIPALIEKGVGNHDWLPSLFFGSFSLLAVVLLSGVARRLGGSQRTAFWVILAGSCSATLFYFARHLVPYDASFAVLCGALFVGVSPARRSGSIILAGFLAGCGFLVYFGYWNLAGFVLTAVWLWPVDWSRWSFGSLISSGLKLAVGFAVPIALAIAINRGWGTGKMIQEAKALSGSIIVGEFDGIVAPWRYLWYSDHLEVVALVVVTLVAAVRPRLATFTPGSVRPVLLAAVWFVALWFSLILTANVLHKFSVHDRLIRQMMPFLLLGFGFGMETLLGSGRRCLAWAMTSLLVVNGALSFIVPLTQEFPAQFERRANALVAEKHLTYTADSYLRFVNVTDYIYEPEVLHDSPIEPILRSRHFYQYRPYLYGGMSRSDRIWRESIDHRMRLVRMPVRPASKITGDPYGQVTLHIQLPKGRAGFAEPLLSMGSWDNGDVFFVRNFSDTSVSFGFYSTGQIVIEGQPLDVAAGSEHDVTFLSGDLLPGGRSKRADRLRELISVTLDAKVVLEGDVHPKDTPPESVFAGVRSTNQNYTAGDFSGVITRAVREDRWPVPKTTLASGVPSTAATIDLATSVGDAPLTVCEPLVVIGETGKALLFYVQRLPGHRARIGLDVWGVGGRLSEPVTTQPTKDDRLQVRIGAVSPHRKTGPKDSARTERLIEVRWNGEKLLDWPLFDWDLADSPVYVGDNPAGGSTTVSGYSGEVVSAKLSPGN